MWKRSHSVCQYHHQVHTDTTAPLNESLVTPPEVQHGFVVRICHINHSRSFHEQFSCSAWCGSLCQYCDNWKSMTLLCSDYSTRILTIANLFHRSLSIACEIKSCWAIVSSSDCKWGELKNPGKYEQGITGDSNDHEFVEYLVSCSH